MLVELIQSSQGIFINQFIKKIGIFSVGSHGCPGGRETGFPLSPEMFKT